VAEPFARRRLFRHLHGVGGSGWLSAMQATKASVMGWPCTRQMVVRMVLRMSSALARVAALTALRRREIGWARVVPRRHRGPFLCLRGSDAHGSAAVLRAPLIWRHTKQRQGEEGQDGKRQQRDSHWHKPIAHI